VGSGTKRLADDLDKNTSEQGRVEDAASVCGSAGANTQVEVKQAASGAPCRERAAAAVDPPPGPHTSSRGGST
jgi:hypothetical protein